MRADTSGYLWRVRVLKYPPGAFEYIEEMMDWVPVIGWKPPGWVPVGNYVKILGTTDFVWPIVHKVYHTEATAKKRAKLLEMYGAECSVERSSFITWPEQTEDHCPYPPMPDNVVRLNTHKNRDRKDDAWTQPDEDIIL